MVSWKIPSVDENWGYPHVERNLHIWVRGNFLKPRIYFKKNVPYVSRHCRYFVKIEGVHKHWSIALGKMLWQGILTPNVHEIVRLQLLSMCELVGG